MRKGSRRTSEARRESPGAARIALCALAPAIIGGLVALYLVKSRAAAGEFGFPLDDSWIHVRFAQHLAQGQGFSFNPGEATSTTTGALWTVLLALAYRVTHEFLFTSIAVNGLLACLLCVVVFELARTMVASRGVALAAGLTVAATAPLPWWVLSGMEPPLYATLSLVAILLHVRLRRAAGIRALAPTVVFALAGLARPECLLLFAFAMLDRLVMARWVDREAGWAGKWGKALAVHVPVFLLLSWPPFIHNYLVTGLALPSSFYSKQQLLSLSGALATGQMGNLLVVMLRAPAKELWSLVVTWAGDNAALILPFGAGSFWLVRETVRGRGEHRSLLLPMALLGQPIVWALTAGYREADFQSQRYIAGLNPLYLLLGVVGGWWIAERVGALRSGAARMALVAVALAASLARQPASATTYALNVKNITEMQVTIARWVRDRAPRSARLAVNDVGAVGVIAGNPVLDLQGLVTPRVLPLRSLKRQMDGTAPAALSEYVFAQEPDYVIIFPRWYPEMDARRDLLTPVFGVRLLDNITCGDAVMVVYRTVWAERHGKEGRE
jgi:hypothetical protein